jgi:prepilin-type N-terminal cleavage/methylation domain-containing protein
MEGTIFMRKNGFSILELMVVIVIIGIIAALAVVRMGDPIERGRSKNAEFNLLAIYAAEKRYFLSEGQYYNSTASLDKVYDINQNLSIRIDDPYFDYSITGSKDWYRAVATRKLDSLKCKNVNMSLTSDNSTVDKRGCSVW